MIIFDDVFLKHKAKHIERPSRLKPILKAAKEMNIKMEKPYEINEKVYDYIKLAHSEEYIKNMEKIFEISKKENKIIYIDPDTYVCPYTKETSLKAVLSVIKAVDLIEDLDFVFCAVRPPGHHAGINGIANTVTQGFCIFNNVAIGSLYASKKYKKIIILDIDLHHGNGTEEIISGKKGIIYISTHAKNIYPGTGYESYENIHNFPLDWGTKDKEYIKLFDEKIYPIIKSFDPDLIFVSLGFDAHKNDPLSVLDITLKSYKHIFEKIREFKVIYVLEGGYNLNVLYRGTKLLFKVYKKQNLS